MSNKIKKIIYDPFCENMKKDSKNKIVELNNFFQKFIDKNNEVLFTLYPIERVNISDSDRNFFFVLSGIEPKEIKTVLKSLDFIKASWKSLNNEFTVLMLCYVRYFYEHKNKELMEKCILFMALQFYVMNHVSRIKYIQKETMIYTVNHLSNKHDLKKFPNIFQAIYKKSLKNHESYSRNLETNSDKDFLEYGLNLNNRIRKWVIGLWLEYIENKNSGRYFNTTADDYSEENYSMNTNSSMEITNLTNKIILKVVKYSVNIKLVKFASQITTISFSSLLNTINELMKKEKIEEIKKLIELIIELYMIEGKRKYEDFSSKDYISYIFSIYSKSNTIDERVLKIKKILEGWLEKYSASYLKTNRVATKINWKKAIFLYFALLIQYNYSN